MLECAYRSCSTRRKQYSVGMVLANITSYHYLMLYDDLQASRSSAAETRHTLRTTKISKPASDAFDAQTVMLAAGCTTKPLSRLASHRITLVFFSGEQRPQVRTSYRESIIAHEMVTPSVLLSASSSREHSDMGHTTVLGIYHLARSANEVLIRLVPRVKSCS